MCRFPPVLLLGTYSSSAALSRLSAAASNFSYTETCDADGNPTTTGEPNCIDLGLYLFAYGPVVKASFEERAQGVTMALVS